MTNHHDKLNGGSVARLARYRRALAKSLETIRACRTPEAAEIFIKNGGYTSPLNHRYAWMGDTHGLSGAIAHKRQSGERIDSVSAPIGMVEAWRDVGTAADILGRRYGGWYADAHRDSTYTGHVWQLPARDGVPQYVAGYTESDGTGYVVLEHDGRGLILYADKEDAARAGDSLAESAAERDREYDERWQEASSENDEREAAREELKAAREDASGMLDALRSLPAGAGRDAVCRAIREKRRVMRVALRTIARATENIADLGMGGEF